MKKLLTLTICLLASFTFAQDNSTITALVNSTTVEQVKSTSDKIAASAGVKFEYYKTTDRNLRDEKYKVIIYTPATFTAEDKKEFSDEEKAQCLQVIWLSTNEGYVFKEVTSSENNIKPFWTATFTSTDDEFRINSDLKYKYVTTEKTASIVKSY